MAREPKFGATIGWSPKPIVGVTLYREGDGKKELTIDEMLDELDKDEVRGARKEILLKKLRERGVLAEKTGEASSQPNPKRYLVDPVSGAISIDELEGEYSFKDAMLVSSSIKGKGGNYDEAIRLITLVKELQKEGQDSSKVAEKPKGYYVDPEQGIIVHDPENGELTLSEARTISQSVQKVLAGVAAPPGFYIDGEGTKHEIQPGQPIVIKKVEREPAKVLFFNPETQTLEEHDPGKPLVIKVQSSANTSPMLPFPAITRDGQPLMDNEGKPIYVDMEPQLKWLDFQGKQKRDEERHDMLMGLGKTVRENFSDIVASIGMAAKEGKGSLGAKTAAGPQMYRCSQCGIDFAIPEKEFTEVFCPNPQCGRVYTKVEIEGVA